MNITKKELKKGLHTMMECFIGAALYYFFYSVSPSNAQSFAVLCVIAIMYHQHKTKLQHIFLR